MMQRGVPYKDDDTDSCLHDRLWLDDEVLYTGSLVTHGRCCQGGVGWVSVDKTPACLQRHVVAGPQAQLLRSLDVGGPRLNA